MTKQEYITKEYKSEDTFTAETHTYINHNYPELRRLYFHIANESATNMAMRLKLHSMGVLAGVPDFCFVYPYLWFLELKIESGRLSDKQKSIHELWRSKGIIVEVCYTPKQVCECLEKIFL